MRAMWNLWDDIPGMSLSFIPYKVAQDPFATLPALESGWVLRKWGASLGDPSPALVGSCIPPWPEFL